MKRKRWRSPADKMLMTKGLKPGRITAKQIVLLRCLGVEFEECRLWTLDRAGKQITRLLDKRDKAKPKSDW